MSDDEMRRGRPAVDPQPIDVTPPPAELADDQRKPGWSRRRKIVLASVFAVALTGVGLAAVAGWRIAEQQHTTLETPSRAAGLMLDESERARSTADYLRSAFAARIDLDNSVGAVYTDPADARRSVLLFGGTTLLWSPERDLDSLFDVVSDDSGAVTGLHEVAAGDLGGVMKCGMTSTGDGDLAVCGWADHGSVAVAMFPGRQSADAGRLMRELRRSVQHRS